MNQHPEIETLRQVLSRADAEDLDVLVDYITDSGKGRISLDKSVCVHLVNARTAHKYEDTELQLIEKEIRRYGGNSIANLFRDVRGLLGLLGSTESGGADALAAEAVTYDEIVKDVAEHLKVELGRSSSTPEREEGIMKSLLIASLEKTTLEQRESLVKDLGIPNANNVAKRGIEAVAAGIAAAVLTNTMAFQLSRTVASATLQALAGRALVVTASSFVARPVVALAGPIGWAITGAWALADMASPAYRVTVPCVVQVAYMRRKTRMRLECSPTMTNSI